MNPKNKLFLISLALFNLALGQKSIKTNLYSKIDEFNNYQFDNSFILSSYDKISKLNCFSICTDKFKDCFFIVYQVNTCLICSMNITKFANYTTSGNSLIYQKKTFKITNGLINYWTFNRNLNDSFGNVHLFGGANALFGLDRFGVPNSVLSLKNGYYQVPPGVYFSGTQLSIMGWIKVRTFYPNSRLIDFGNGKDNENILLTLSSNTNDGKPYVMLRSGNNYFFGNSIKSLILNKWQHLACVFSFPFYSIYIDGIEVTTPGSKTNFASFSLANVLRSSNFIGRSNYPNNQDVDADFDDLKFFNRALTPSEIQFEMNNNL
jgi:hypothetical protein